MLYGIGLLLILLTIAGCQQRTPPAVLTQDDGQETVTAMLELAEEVWVDANIKNYQITTRYTVRGTDEEVTMTITDGNITNRSCVFRKGTGCNDFKTDVFFLFQQARELARMAWISQRVGDKFEYKVEFDQTYFYPKRIYFVGYDDVFEWTVISLKEL